MSGTTRKLIHTTAIKMRWGDMDALGHLNNTYYFRYMEQARIEWLDSLAAPIEPGKIGPVIAHIACDFKQELVYPATVLVKTFATHVGRSTMTAELDSFLQHDAATIYATGHAVLVWVDYEKGGSIAIPQAVRSQCE